MTITTIPRTITTPITYSINSSWMDKDGNDYASDRCKKKNNNHKISSPSSSSSQQQQHQQQQVNHDRDDASALSTQEEMMMMIMMRKRSISAMPTRTIRMTNMTHPRVMDTVYSSSPRCCRIRLCHYPRFILLLGYYILFFIHQGRVQQQQQQPMHVLSSPSSSSSFLSVYAWSSTTLSSSFRTTTRCHNTAMIRTKTGKTSLGKNPQHDAILPYFVSFTSFPITPNRNTCLFMSAPSQSSHQASSSWITTLPRQGLVSLLIFFMTFISPIVIHSISSPFFSTSTTTTATSIIRNNHHNDGIVVWAEDELYTKYKNKGLDTSLVDQTCFINHCSTQVKTCLVDDVYCRKGLICTGKCLGDNACITGCMAQYGNEHLDSFLKCSIEDYNCIQIAILEGGNDLYTTAPLAPSPTITRVDLIDSLQGTWYKIMGFNPNYDCYPCQRNTFTSNKTKKITTTTTPLLLSSSSYNQKLQQYDEDEDVQLQVEVEFSLPRLLSQDEIISSSTKKNNNNIPISFYTNSQKETISFIKNDDDDASNQKSMDQQQQKNNNIFFLEQNPTTTTSTSLVSADSTKNNNNYRPNRPMSIGYNHYHTHEVMIFDSIQEEEQQQQSLSSLIPTSFLSTTTSWNQNLVSKNNLNFFTLGKGTNHEVSYRRTAHTEGEMFGLKFWENWYIIGENDPGMQEFKFIYYNGKTRQNTYEGAFVYSRSKSLNADALQKVYKIASDAKMNPNSFCQIQNNGCFQENNNDDDEIKELEQKDRMHRQEKNKKEGTSNVIDYLGSPTNPFRGILASTKVSQLLGVEPVGAEGVVKSNIVEDQDKSFMEGEIQDNTMISFTPTRPWYKELGDYLENPHRHYNIIDSLRVPMKWPDTIVKK